MTVMTGFQTQKRVAWGALLLWMAFYTLFQGVDSRWVDFPVFFEAGKKAFQGLTVYDVSGHFQFKYSPFIAALFGWVFHHITFETASFYYQKLIVVMWVLWIAYWVLRQGFKDYGFVLLLTMGVFFNPLKLEIQLGQTNVFVMALLVGALIFDERSKKHKIFNLVIVSTFLSLAIQMKLYCALFLPLYFFKKQWMVLIFTFFIYGITNVLFLSMWQGWAFAISENINWIQSLTTSSSGLLFSHWNTSFIGFFGRVLGGQITMVLWVGAVCAYLYLLYKLRNIKIDVLYSLTLLTVVILNPLVWSYWVIFLIPFFLLGLRSYGSELRQIKTKLFVKNKMINFVFVVVVFFSFQLQQAKLNLKYGIFLGIVCFLFLFRKFLVDQTADYLRARSRL